MSSVDDAPKELVIIRRRSGDDLAAPKGGVWKIAYADFMTAMMAFFLVMWLINAANEATRVQVASYFNPVKLVDTRTNAKGLQDLDTGTEGPAKQKPAGEGDKDASGKMKEAKGTGKFDQERSSGLPLEATRVEHTEQSLFQDPYVVLAELAKEAGAGSDTDEKKTGVLPEVSGRPGLRGGEGYVDPFDPSSWRTIADASERAQQAQSSDAARGLAAEIDAVTGKKAAPAPAPDPEVGGKGRSEVAAEAQGPAQDARAEDGKETVRAAAQLPASDQAVSKVASAEQQTSNVQSKTEAVEGSQPAPATGRTAKVSETVEKEAASLRSEIEEAAGEAGPGHAPLVEVKTTDEGVLLSLTDTTSFGMFDIASAKPRAELVRFMEKVAKALNERPGAIIIRGHTDGRPFRSETYDNWRLSAARAHMAYYMLVRGGIEEKRVERIEGHADRALKLPSDPEAAENRRIEILVRPDGT